MEKLEKVDAESQNVYAYNTKFEEIHISQAKSGRKGYFCLGCKREMQAVISQKVNRISYFRHDAKAVKNQPKCSYSDETHRHKLAKNILQIKKTAMVPRLYKYPPKGEEGKAILIRNSEQIIAHAVRNEIYFFEDSNGNVCWGNKEQHHLGNLLFNPDVTFFNKDKEPILLIEIVATNKISEEKKVKIKRLGIDTIRINIPKASPEEIEKIFTNTNYTKWIYNYEQENTEYLEIPNGNNEEVSPIDEIQRSLFEETYKCRKSEVENLIRSITRCLESEQFSGVIRDFELEIRKTEGNSKRAAERLDELQNGHREEVKKKLSGEEQELGKKEREFSSESSKLERRYLNKRGKLILEKETLGRNTKEAQRVIKERFDKFKGEERRIEEALKTERKRRDRIKKETDELEHSIREEEKRTFGEYERLERGLHRSAESAVQRRIDLPEKVRKEIETTEKQIIEDEKSTIRRIEEYKQERKRLIEQFEIDRKELNERFRKLREIAYSGIEARTSRGNTRFASDFKKLLSYRTLLEHFKEKYDARSRIRKAREIISNGTYKNWGL